MRIPFANKFYGLKQTSQQPKFVIQSSLSPPSHWVYLYTLKSNILKLLLQPRAPTPQPHFAWLPWIRFSKYNYVEKISCCARICFSENNHFQPKPSSKHNLAFHFSFIRSILDKVQRFLNGKLSKRTQVWTHWGRMPVRSVRSDLMTTHPKVGQPKHHEQHAFYEHSSAAIILTYWHDALFSTSDPASSNFSSTKHEISNPIIEQEILNKLILRTCNLEFWTQITPFGWNVWW